MYSTLILSAEVTSHGSKKESQGHEEEGLQEQEDQGKEEEVKPFETQVIILF
jgi:hypothetical protein